MLLAAVFIAAGGCGRRPGPDQAAWAIRMDGETRFGPASGQGLVFVVSEKGTLSAFSPTQGSNVWSVTGLGRPLAGPVAAGPAVCQATMDGHVYGVSAWTGARLWTLSPFGPLPMRAEGRFVSFLNALDGHVYGLDAMTGTLKWDVDPGRGPITGPVIHSNMVYLVEGRPADGDSRRLLGLAGDTGAIRLEIPLDDDVSELAVWGGVVYLAHATGLVWAIEAATPRLLWRRQTGQVLSTPLVARPDGVYYGTRNGGLVALDPATGEERWRFAAGQDSLTALALDGGQAFVAEWRRHWLAVDLAARAVLWKAPAPAAGRAPPAFAERWVVWTTPDGWVRGFPKTPMP
jgi:outer membrane protein assembly factor BamB